MLDEHESPLDEDDNRYGTCVVLTVGPNDLPNVVKGGQHITLAYFSDEPIEDYLEIDLIRTCSDIVESLRGPLRIKTEHIDHFGTDGEAVVLTLNPHPESIAVSVREMLLKMITPELRELFDRNETFPEYKPHMTLGYTNDPSQYSSELDFPHELYIPEYLTITGLAVWNGSSRISLKHDSYIQHYGILRKSGRYPWGSGANPYQRSMGFYEHYNKLRAEGLTDLQIAAGLGLVDDKGEPNTTVLRATIAIAKNQKITGQRAIAQKYREDRQMSNTAIADRMGINESSVRALLKPGAELKQEALMSTANYLKSQADEVRYLDVGKGTEQYLNVSRNKLKVALAILKEEGYQLHYVRTPQPGTGELTSVEVLVPPGVKYSETYENRDKIQNISGRTDDGGFTFKKSTRPPESISSKRVSVRYAEDGGADKDGLIEIRPGAKDLDLGNARYAQVRILVDDSHYLKGMALYSDNMPSGVDIVFNTNKTKSEAPGKLDALKKVKDDAENPFGSQLKAGGQNGAINIVNEEGDWNAWAKTLSSQMLSKQPDDLAKRQLALTYDIAQTELETITSLTNPTIKKKLLQSYADNADAAAVRLKAQGLPQTSNHVILPIPEMKENEIYAPNYKNGERVVLIRHPHGGVFEIPELVVNNNRRVAKSILKDARDAVGINPKVAEQLSGADFDGDTVLVIPQREGPGKVRRSNPLPELKDFDPKVRYKIPEDDTITPRMTKVQTQREMGNVSNLITDMTIKGANNGEIARAVKHSMVVIDAEKHGLDYRQSAIDNGIAELKRSYQGGSNKGAATLISRAKSEIRNIPERKLRLSGEGGGIDPVTGELVWVPTGNTRVNKQGETVLKTIRSPKMAETKDAHSLVSDNGGSVIERIYADHANQMKGLANKARLELLKTGNLQSNPTAKKVYKKEVDELVAALNMAYRNKPLERQATLLANAEIAMKRQANPDMDSDTLKKVKSQALDKARARTGAKKQQIVITPRQWEAIQAGAISENRLSEILANTDVDKLKEMAMPRTKTGLIPAQLSKAKAMLARGYTQAEVAEALGVSASTLNKALS